MRAMLALVDLGARIRSLVDERDGTWGVYARNLDTGETIDVDADTIVPAQSALKTGVLITYANQVTAGKLDPDGRVPFTEEWRVVGSGVMRHLAAGLEPTRDDLAWLMTVISDNVATAMLIMEIGGPDAMNAQLAEYALTDAYMGDDGRGGYGFMASPRALAECYVHLDERCREILFRQQFVDWLPRRVPHISSTVDHGTDMPVRAYVKGGWAPGECVDAGLFESERASWIVAAMARDLPDVAHRADNDGPRTLADIGELLYDAWGK